MSRPRRRALDRHLGAQLSVLRQRRGWSVEMLAAAAGVSARVVGDYEGGGRHIEPPRLASFAHLLGVTPGDFFAAAPRPPRRRALRRYRRTLGLVRAYCRIPPARRREMMTLLQDAAADHDKEA